MKREKKQPDAVKIQVDAVNEVVLLAAVVADPVIRRRYLTMPSDCFFGAGHAEMWIGLQTLYSRGLDYSPETMRTIAGDKFDPDVLDEYVRSRSIAPVNIRHHVDCLRWDKRRADAARGPVPDFLEVLRDPTAEPDRLKGLASQIKELLSGAGDLRYLRDSEQIVQKHERELDERRAGRAVYPYGIAALDFYGPNDEIQKIGKARISLEGKARMVPGMAPSQTTVITGVSGSGKSTFTARVVLEQAARGRRVLWGAWEQEPGISLELAAALSLGMSRGDLMTGDFSQAEQADLLAEMRRLGEWIRFFELPFRRHRGERFERWNDKNLDLLHEYIAESGCSVFVGDVFKYALYETKPEEEDAALKRMRGIASELKIHNILIQHLSLKDVERRPDKRPTRESVMGSTGWINVPDTVIGVHNPSLFDSQVGADKLELHILKQRYGRWPLAIEFDWDGEFGTIENGKSLDLPRPGEKSEIDEYTEEPKAPRFSRGRQRRK
jgi:hypothetical protein